MLTVLAFWETKDGLSLESCTTGFFKRKKITYRNVSYAANHCLRLHVLKTKQVTEWFYLYCLEDTNKIKYVFGYLLESGIFDNS